MAQAPSVSTACDTIGADIRTFIKQKEHERAYKPTRSGKKPSYFQEPVFLQLLYAAAVGTHDRLRVPPFNRGVR
jgi:hypothetical protein